MKPTPVNPTLIQLKNENITNPTIGASTFTFPPFPPHAPSCCTQVITTLYLMSVFCFYFKKLRGGAV